MLIEQNYPVIQELHTFRDMVRWGATEFNKAKLTFGHGFDNAWDEALFLARKILHLSMDEETKAADARLLTVEKQAIAELYQRRIQQKIPSPYLVNEAWFAGLPFYVDQRVIIPRSPIAELIEVGFEPYLDPQRVTHILDLCTGSGCIAIACSMAFPDAQVDAVDISPDALAVAEKNIQLHQVEDRVRLWQADLFAPLPEAAYDLIVSNPPYVSEEEMLHLPTEYSHEPTLALAAGIDGLAVVKRILKEVPRYLAPGGVLVVEVGNSAESLIAAFPDLPFLWLEFNRGGQGVFLLTKEQL